MMSSRIIKFLPLFILYILIILIFSSTSFHGDESGYVAYASRLANVDYPHADEFKDLQLWWGPGYPIFLMPFAFLHLPWLIAKLMNAVFLFIALQYLYRTLLLWLKEKHAFIISLIVGAYPPFWIESISLYTESLVFLLICGLMFHYCQSFKSGSHQRFHLLLASIFLAYLALTKIFFGYLILFGLVVSLILLLWKRRPSFKRTALIYGLAFAWCLPYLIYTHSLTGKECYWGSSGGMSLYWMSTPYQNEWGSWFSSKNVKTYPELIQHRDFFQQIDNLSEFEKDDAYKKQAIYNILHHPIKYFKNWTANIGRLLFSYPYTRGHDRLTTFFYLIPNMFIVVLLILSIYPAWVRRSAIPYELISLLAFVLIAFGGTSLVSAYERQFRPFVPILVLWLSFVYTHIMKIEIRH